ncbi:MAG: hypothetical protein GY832_01260 [Chloroflexi bacterium]|nr:hypothetical protein [Chloroflexota bacterium]
MKRKTLFNMFFVLSLVFGSLLIQPAVVSFAQTDGDAWAWGHNIYDSPEITLKSTSPNWLKREH